MEYINDNFLLTTPLAQQLYHDYAATMPIIDYHNHLEAKDIYLDVCAENITQAWLEHDHYVWRAMRANGVCESFITGDKSAKEKFSQWCKSAPKLLGNPLYQWSHLELKRFFNCDLLINQENEKQLWEITKQKLSSNSLSTRSVLQMCKVSTLCTTDSPMSDLIYHQQLANSNFAITVLPTFRADELFAITNPIDLRSCLSKLNTVCEEKISNFDSFIAAIENRVQFFHKHGCRLSDLGLPTVDFEPCTAEQANTLFCTLLSGASLTKREVIKLTSRLFVELGRLYHQYNWTMQIHISVLANVNKRRKLTLGKGTGFSVINDQNIAQPLCQLLSTLDEQQQLAQTILYSLNPIHNPILGAIIGAFQDSDRGAGKIQLGAAWWFNDHKDGMQAQLCTLKNLGALGHFIGMLTDSRNIFSMSRHEYFRRVLCNQLATWVEQGELPYDLQLLKQNIENICYFNAKNYFNFPDQTSLKAAL